MQAGCIYACLWRTQRRAGQVGLDNHAMHAEEVRDHSSQKQLSPP
jgi:hypothetical protein